MTVNYSSRTLLVVTWAPPQKSRVLVYGNARAFQHLQFKGRSVHTLHSHGLIVSYHEVATRTWESKVSHPHNLLYGFQEPNGISLILTCFANVWKSAGTKWTPNIAAVDLSAGEKCIARSARASRIAARFHQNLRPTDDPTISRTQHDYDGLILPTIGSATSGQPAGIVAFKHTFPSDVAAEIVSFLDTQTLRSFSRVNSRCNDLADRRLWRTFHVAAERGDEARDADARITALLRNPRRALFVQSLILGPCGWRWSEDLLEKLEKALIFAGNLASLRFVRPSMAQRAWGGEFSPVLRLLARNGARIQLRSFEFDDFLDESTALIDFLATQTGLRRLAGLDIPGGRLPILPQDFLPSLSIIESSVHNLPVTLIQGRPIKSILVSHDPVYRDTVSDRLDALSGSTTDVESLGLVTQYGCSDEDVLYIYGQVAARLPHLRELRTNNFVFRPYAFDFLRQFTRLECFHCRVGSKIITATGFADWIVQAPSTLKRVVFWNLSRGTVVWSRGLSARYGHAFITTKIQLSKSSLETRACTSGAT